MIHLGSALFIHLTGSNCLQILQLIRYHTAIALIYPLLTAFLASMLVAVRTILCQVVDCHPVSFGI